MQFRAKLHPRSFDFYSDASGQYNHGVGAFINQFAVYFLWSDVDCIFPHIRRFDFKEKIIYSSYNTEYIGLTLCLISFIILGIIPPNSLVNIYNDNNGVLAYYNKLKEPKFARLSEIFNMLCFEYRISIIAHEIKRSHPFIVFCDAISKKYIFTHRILIKNNFLYDLKHNSRFSLIKLQIKYILNKLKQQSLLFDSLKKYNSRSSLNCAKVPHFFNILHLLGNF